MPKTQKDPFQKIDDLERFVRRPFNPQEHKDKTRSHIAKLFTWGYLIIITVALIGTPIYNLFSKQSLDTKETLVTLSSVIGTPFGFIVGYYFKSGKD